MLQSTNLIPERNSTSYLMVGCDRPIASPVFNVMERPKLIEDLGRLYPTTTSKEKKRFGLYECPYCGNTFKARSSGIKAGHPISCGCMVLKSVFKHGMSHTKIHDVWQNMKSRCYQQKKHDYKYYGGRGITVCDEWREYFINFYNWAMINGYKEGLEIDRIKNDLNYSPDNCRFITGSQNTQNTRILRSNNTSGFRGVHFNRKNNNWNACVMNKRRVYYLGTFCDSVSAAIAYNNWVIEHKTLHPLNNI